MSKIIRRIQLEGLAKEERAAVLSREWLATNGLGGYASSTLAGLVTWRYHGLLIAALPAPFGRVVMLNHLAELLRCTDGSEIPLSGREGEPGEGGAAVVSEALVEFRLENGLPVWRFQSGDMVLEKYLLFLYGQNTVHIGYRLLGGQGTVRLELYPSCQFRRHEQAVNEGPDTGYSVTMSDGRYEVALHDGLPPLRLVMKGQPAQFTYDGGSRREVYYQKESERGYQPRGCLWSPGYFAVNLRSGQTATLIASTETWHTMLALNPEEALTFHHDRYERLVQIASPAAHESPAADLVIAADQFIITPAGRIQDAARARAAGDEIRTVIAGYHWFTDWGRDTMISLEGLTLTTNRLAEAGWILRTFAHYTRDGLIPNMFPEGENAGLYHTADATLWFFHALDCYLAASGDLGTLRHIYPKLVDIIQHHIKGTRFGIEVDPRDGLLKQGAEGYQLTWMDAKVEGWVVTPRRGKAVEINGLWYNALKLMQRWAAEQGDPSAAQQYGEWAERTGQSFNSRFWYAEGGYLYDIVDGEHGDDNACRPNQLLAFSLRNPVLESDRWEPVLNCVRERLLTPLGLRSLSRDNPDYKAKYFGDLRARDAAYHQGTVWAWLIGPFIDAYLKVYPEDKVGARKFLQGFVPHLDDGAVGSINEIFDAEPPFTPRGCIAQAWSVAEVLRCWVKTA